MFVTLRQLKKYLGRTRARSFLFTDQSNQSISLSRTLIGADIFQVLTGNISVHCAKSQKLRQGPTRSNF